MNWVFIWRGNVQMKVSLCREMSRRPSYTLCLSSELQVGTSTPVHPMFSCIIILFNFTTALVIH